jgi:hypothetical protein
MTAQLTTTNTGGALATVEQNQKEDAMRIQRASRPLSSSCDSRRSLSCDSRSFFNSQPRPNSGREASLSQLYQSPALID